MAGKEQPIDNLAKKAGRSSCTTAGVGSVVGQPDRVVEKRYKELGGKITVIVRAGEGHFPLSPKDPKPVVDFIIKNAPIPVTKGDATTSPRDAAASKDGCANKQAGDSFRWTAMDRLRGHKSMSY